MDDFAKAAQEVSKYLGKNARVPQEPAALKSAWKNLTASLSAMHTDCASAISKCGKAVSNLQSEAKRFSALLEKDDFHLYPKSEEKKIQIARKVLSKVVEGSVGITYRLNKDLTELEKHLRNLGAYRSP
jgi:hypothetical protein